MSYCVCVDNFDNNGDNHFKRNQFRWTDKKKFLFLPYSINFPIFFSCLLPSLFTLFFLFGFQHLIYNHHHHEEKMAKAPKKHPDCVDCCVYNNNNDI